MKKYVKLTLVIILSLLAIALVYIMYTPGKKMVYDPGPEFAYRGFADVKNGKYERFREYISLRDGEQLAVTYFVPNQRVEGKAPTILLYSPYTQSIVVPDMPLVQRTASKYYLGLWGPVYDKIGTKALNTFTSHGYAVALVEMRGTGASTGHSGRQAPQSIQTSGSITMKISPL